MSDREMQERVASLCATRPVEVMREIQTMQSHLGGLAREIQFLLSEHARLNGCPINTPSNHLN
jgi:hypothetical protein